MMPFCFSFLSSSSFAACAVHRFVFLLLTLLFSVVVATDISASSLCCN